ncbi:carbonate dehydratase [Chryseotalea sanaruensis]|uniref:Carbonic anhydrase 2 n=1 Tax=Chryseotalea sanaruensis TaxID=2482724 RepID=A0A401UDZ2_9BACT|nr:carbonate dehydratase [Chryseotalea sanaruensis]GCC53103.1 carbonate dehydratase [Chryseotalea sanaruensis]
MPQHYNDIFTANKQWVQSKLGEDEQYFEKLSKGQKPPFLWIGCSDSRVPANEITGTAPGEVFVHRNIANMVIHTDMSMLSVLDYAVNVLEVRHVIVCGHYGCGGVLAAMGQKQFGLIDNWLRHIKDVYRLHHEELDAIEDESKRADRLVELNVQEQVFDLTKTTIIQNAWAQGRFLQVHGLVYSIANGILKDLNVTVGDNSEIEGVYKLQIKNKILV